MVEVGTDGQRCYVTVHDAESIPDGPAMIDEDKISLSTINHSK
jgi:hypothetical protein